jgi:hypothetical protein
MAGLCDATAGLCDAIPGSAIKPSEGAGHIKV